MSIIHSYLRFKKISVVTRCCLLTIFLLFVLIPAQATNYYFSTTSGNDAYTSTQAQNPNTPWKSIAKLNSFFNNLNAGDKILFNRGDVFYGSIVFTKSGTSALPIVIDAYGSGNRPVITGLTTLSSWNSIGGGIFQSSAPAVKSSVNLLTLNGKPQEVGRFPNSDAANGGYLIYETYSGTNSITDNQLNSSPNWTGAEAVIRKQHYLLERCKITSHSGNTIAYTTTPVINPANGAARVEVGTNGFGYFFQRDARTLDKFGEWYFDPGQKNMLMYFGGNNPASYNIQVSTLDTLVNINNKNFVTISNISFEGANLAAIYARDGGNITVQNCDINNTGAKGIFIFNSPNILIDNVKTSYNLSNAIDVTNRFAANVTIRNCNISKTGTLTGMGAFWDNGEYKGIYIDVSSNGLLEYNNVDTTGYTAIHWQGNNMTIKNNFVNYYNYVKEDGGGIYTFTTAAEYYTNRVVRDNIVMNGIGAVAGTGGDLNVQGIYLDGSTMNVDVLNNSVANVGTNAFYCNNPTNVKIQGNTSFNNGSCVAMTQYADLPVISNFNISNNIFYPKYEHQYNFRYANTGLNIPSPKTIETALEQIGYIDNNFLNFPNASGFDYYYKVNAGGSYTFPSPMSFEAWKAASKHDLSSTLPPRKIPTYKLNSLIGPNKVTNGQFNSDINNTSFFADNGNNTSSWDNTGKLGTGGSLKVTPSISVSSFTFVFKAVGAITANKKYIVRFSTLGSGKRNVVNAVIRQTQDPYSFITDKQSKPFSDSRVDHEFLLTAFNTQSDATLEIEVQQLSGATYIDNIEVYEADATPINIDTQLRFEYNATTSEKTVSLDGNYFGVGGTLYSGAISLPPYTSKVLIRDTGTAAIGGGGVTSTLKATVSAANIGCFGGSTTATVSATGGTPPYSSAGTFTASAGVGSVKLSFPTSVASNYTSIFGAIGSVSSSKNYVVRFSTLGTTAQGFLRVYLGQEGAPFARISSSLPNASFGTSRVDHQFIFTAPTSDATANFVIEVIQSAGTTYIDNIAVFESSATGELIGTNKFTGGQFESDINNIRLWSSNNNQVVTWDNTSKINSVNYYTVFDAVGGTSTAVLNTNQVTSPLQASAVAGSISTIGGTTNVTISASGGTAPYTGTGVLSGVKAGIYSYTVTDANGCTATSGVTIVEGTTPITGGAPLKSTFTASNITCFGGTSTVMVSATGGTPPYSSTGNFTATAGVGSLKMSFPSSIANTNSSIFGAIGAISSSKNYVVRFSSLGTTSEGFLRVYLGQAESPYGRISTTLPSASFGTSIVDHQFIFTAPPSISSANFVIEISQASGTTYIDNISVFEINSAGDLVGGNMFTGGQFESNINNIRAWSPNNNQVVTWDNSSKISSVYYYTVYDALGLTSTTVFNTSQVSAPLIASATAGSITVSGGTTTVSVFASGGVAPYSGDDTFTGVKAGNYTYTVIDANGCSSSTNITITENLSSVLTSNVTASKINCYGGTSTVVVSATGGTQPYSTTGTYIASAGSGSIKIAFPSTVSNTYTSIFGSIGFIGSSKSYVLRFTTLGTTSQGFVRAYLGQAGTPYGRISSNLPSASFGTSRVEHEFILNSPEDINANFVIEVSQASGTTYIDNISVFEIAPGYVLRGGYLFSGGQFEENINNIRVWSPNNNQVVTWDNTSKISNIYYYTVYDATGATSTSVVGITQPSAPLQAFSSAPAITSVGGRTNITVTASGGTAPYDGTGTFNVGAGTFTYTVTDANFCTAVTTISTTVPAARIATTVPATRVATTQVLTNSNSSSNLKTSTLSISAFPNPTANDWGLLVEGGSNEKLEISVKSMDGRVVYSTKGSSNQKYTFGSHLLPGMYIVQVLQGYDSRIIKVVKTKSF